MESKVIERDSEFEVEIPQGEVNTIDPFEFLKTKENPQRTSLIILNQPIKEIDLYHLWRNSELVVCADGGANQLYDYFEKDSERGKYIPKFIVGDMDSLKSEVEEYYKQKGSVIIPQYSQYSSDFMKAIQLIQLYFYSPKMKETLIKGKVETNDGLHQMGESLENGEPIEIFVLSAIGGRFDQTIHTINQLYVLNDKYPKTKFYLITQEDIIFLVDKGKNYIRYPSKSLIHSNGKPICGLLPIGNEVILNTTGLKWDVYNWESSMKGNVSSSNWLMGKNGVLIETSDIIVMNIEMEHRKRSQ